MFRFLIIAAAIALAVVIVYRMINARQSQPREQRRVLSHDTVRCSHCGVHVPRDEAVLSGDKAYCSRDHARLGQDRPSG